MQNVDETIEIRILERIKTSGPNRKQQILGTPFYKECENICTGAVQQYYIERTEKIITIHNFIKPVKRRNTNRN